jgi:apolipoprotein N-acyltransferase
VTNDGWFGRTSGPYQHVAQARLRTIEQGLPMIRAANTGISAIIDPYGRYVARLPLGVEGVLDGALPQPIAATPFSRAPYFIPIGLWAALLLLTGGAALRARRA